MQLQHDYCIGIAKLLDNIYFETGNLFRAVHEPIGYTVGSDSVPTQTS